MVSSHGMHRIRIIALLFCAISIVADSGFADTPFSRLTQVEDKYLRELERSGTVKRDLGSWREAELIPQHRFADDIRNSLSDARPNVLSETLILIRRGVSDEEFLTLYNSLRRVSDLADIDYYNPEKDKWHPLFSSSYRVPDKETDTKLPDPLVSEIPESDRFIVRQGLPPFGDTVSRYVYTHGHNAFHFQGHNLTRITYKEIGRAHV